MIIDNKMEFTQEELQLLYAACMGYGDKLSEVIKVFLMKKFINYRIEQKKVGTLQGKLQSIWRLIDYEIYRSRIIRLFRGSTKMV